MAEVEKIVPKVESDDEEEDLYETDSKIAYYLKNLSLDKLYKFYKAHCSEFKIDGISVANFYNNRYRGSVEQRKSKLTCEIMDNLNSDYSILVPLIKNDKNLKKMMLRYRQFTVEERMREEEVENKSS